MKVPTLILIALAVSAVASFAVARMTLSHPRESAASSAMPAEVTALADRLAGMESRQLALEKAIEDLRLELATTARPEARVPMGEIEAAVARAMESRGSASAVTEGTPAAPVTGGTSYDSKAAFAELLDMSWEDAQAKWKAIAEAGGLDEMVALFEEYAKSHPDSPEAQVKLGEAYLQKVFRAGNGPETGMWAVKADKAFDAALALDDHHWDARFSKAISLSFWPPVFGKQTEAIKHFEILAEQQASMQPQPDHAQTWLLLGNMYQQIGKTDQALATWQKGLALFPDNAALQQQIANAGGH